MNLKPFLKQLQAVCRDNNVSMLGVFGSVARGDDTPESDIDLLVKLEDKFKDIFGRKVDLATEGALHPLIRQGVFSDLKVIYEK